MQKSKKVVRIVLYELAISQSDCRKAGPYQLLYNNSLRAVQLSTLSKMHVPRIYMKSIIFDTLASFLHIQDIPVVISCLNNTQKSITN